MSPQTQTRVGYQCLTFSYTAVVNSARDASPCSNFTGWSDNVCRIRVALVEYVGPDHKMI